MDPNEQPPSWTGGDAPDKEKMEQVRIPLPSIIPPLSVLAFCLDLSHILVCSY